MSKYIYISLLILSTLKLNAQFTKAHTWSYHSNYKDPKYYILVSPYISSVYYKNYGGDLFTSFQYQSLARNTGTLTNQTFSAHTTNLFSKNHLNAGGEIEVGKKFYFNMKIGGMGYMANVEGSMGMGYNLFFNKSNRHRSEPEKYFLLKFCLSLGENVFTQHLGTIDNAAKDIYMLNAVAPAVVAVTNRYGNIHYYNAQTLHVDYEQTIYSLVPQISFANNPYKSRFHFQVDVGWLLPFFQTGGLSLDQLVSNSGDKLVEQQNYLYPHYFNSQTNGLTLQYNGNPITKTPFNLGGPLIKFGIGINIGSLKK
jgi:hypothetical protein